MTEINAKEMPKIMKLYRRKYRGNAPNAMKETETNIKILPR